MEAVNLTNLKQRGRVQHAFPMQAYAFYARLAVVWQEFEGRVVFPCHSVEKGLINKQPPCLRSKACE